MTVVTEDDPLGGFPIDGIPEGAAAVDQIDGAAARRIARIAAGLLQAPAACVSRIARGRTRILGGHLQMEGLDPSLVVKANRRVAIALARSRSASALVLDLGAAGSLLAASARGEHAWPLAIVSVYDPTGSDFTAEQKSRIEDAAALLSSEIRLHETRSLARRREARKALIVREMEHRLKNSLSTVQALVSLSLRGEGTISAMRDRLIERIGAMSKTQSLLLSDALESADLADIIASEAAHYVGAERFVWSGPAVRAGAADAAAVGMVLHELSTNAAKHGALAPGREGRVEIGWTVYAGPPTGRRVSLEWRESTGPSKIAAPVSSGFGTTLLDMLVSGQLHGTIERDWAPGGLIVRTDFALADASPSAD
ncbi:sensor histidine kinase [Aurantimonas sp. Leaf443]|uniref:sensor histidine kinase n=1 Tax=Aurantimonas sp. Leaf443 TaxID=1736378 RepID=UPI0006FDE2BE|nr:sensor histidine kinase [Aurantimonas sp. Leaf443]KQT88470.1 hypothetical protein ASG48_03405 [Aurantimonas sp. Leaf443]